MENNFIDTSFGGQDTGAAAIYFNDNGTTFTDEIASYDVADNILNNSVVISNGVGDDTQAAIGAHQLITGNTFEGVYVAGSMTSFDTIVVRGDEPGIGWLLEPAQIPTSTGNVLDNSRPFLLRGSDTYGSAPGDAIRRWRATSPTSSNTTPMPAPPTPMCSTLTTACIW